MKNNINKIAKRFMITSMICLFTLLGWVKVKESITKYNLKQLKPTIVENVQLQEMISYFDDLGIRVHINEKYNEIFMESTEWDHDDKISEDEALWILTMFKESVEELSDEMVNAIPRDIFLVKEVSKDDAYVYAQVSYHMFLEKSTPNYMMLSYPFYISYNKYKSVINHELFHVYEKTFMTENEIKKFNSINESCSVISDYACTNTSEELAEAWSHHTYDNETAKGEYLHQTYDSLFFK